MDIERDGNYIEAGVWFLCAVLLLVKAVRGDNRFRRTLLFLTITVAVFGCSDLVEARTGAWWQPWWLLAWKVICVAGLLAGFRDYYRISKQPPARP